ncbi:MAG: ABC transporter ATP-binding protein [Vicinamibacteraceae bacterium]|nr:ABC transporter ATP-binding protein [Vicinamibacteraceae bacterium]
MIAFERFGKRFGAQVAVEALSLRVGTGEVFALLGPNGSGKTTSLKAAAGLIAPTSGAVLLGEPPRPAVDPAARDVCSFLPQKVSFPDALTGLEVVHFYARLRGAPRSRARDVLEFTALNGAGARAVGTYSGGMIQRLGLAVASIPGAAVLLLDEPTASLDPVGLQAFHVLVEQHRRDGRTVFFTSHQLDDVERLADRIAILVEGRLIATFTRTELTGQLADRGVMRLVLGRRPADLAERLTALAPRATLEGDELVVPGPASRRPGVIAGLQDLGVDIRSLTAEEGRLDAFYRELIGDPP